MNKKSRGPVLSNVEGFTLVETMVAIAIVTIAIVGPLMTASRTLVAAYTASDQLTASYLASEAIEYVQSMRDTMYLADYQANQGDASLPNDSFCDLEDPDPSDDCAIPPANSGAELGTCIGPGDGSVSCMLADPLATMGIGTGDSLKVCSSSGCSPLYLQTTGGVSRYTTKTSGTATSFVRTIQLYTEGTGAELEVVVTVSWIERGVPYKLSLTDYLSPWQ
jgi:prepilin-type N-terminal cleavage/methylation domain-containing protein